MKRSKWKIQAKKKEVKPPSTEIYSIKWQTASWVRCWKTHLSSLLDIEEILENAL